MKASKKAEPPGSAPKVPASLGDVAVASDASQSMEMLARFVERARAKAPGVREDEIEFIAHTLRTDFVNAVNDHLNLYRSERNGLSVWRALKACHDAGEPIPTNVLAKFAQWAALLESAESPGAVAKALDLAGDRDRYKGAKHLRSIEKRRAVASEVELVRRTFRVTLKTAIDTVARNRNLKVPDVKSQHHRFFHGRPKPKEGVIQDLSLDETMRRIAGRLPKQ